jgi:hypothetical protein
MTKLRLLKNREIIRGDFLISETQTNLVKFHKLEPHLKRVPNSKILMSKI